MDSRKYHFAVLLLVSGSLMTTGCGWGWTTFGPSVGILSVPVPVSPYFQDQHEDDFGRAAELSKSRRSVIAVSWV